ncbi:MAG: hypothetical protein M0009_12895 [Deltaproteobacteria bacterium]|nr:hypothetical protein [Deltaproteobacteria bacterium]
MENSGWIKLHRAIMDHADWLSEPFTRAQAWVDLLLLANHKTGFIRRRGIMVAVERGQVGYSEVVLAERWQWSKGKVRRFISELTRLSQVSRKISEKTVPKKTSVSNLILIINYEKYQGSDTEDDTENGPKMVPEQEEKEGKEIKPFLSNSAEVRLSELLFEKILSRNPKHKKPNIQTWAKDVDQMIRIDHRTPEDIRRVIEWCQSDPFWKNNILSSAKLRKQFDQLLLKMNGDAKTATPFPFSHSLKCPRCGRELVVKNDLYGEGCIHCQRAMEARA